MRVKEHLSTVYIWNATWQQGSNLHVCSTDQFYSDADKIEQKEDCVFQKIKFIKKCASLYLLSSVCIWITKAFIYIYYDKKLLVLIAHQNLTQYILFLY